MGTKYSNSRVFCLFFEMTMLINWEERDHLNLVLLIFGGVGEGNLTTTKKKSQMLVRFRARLLENRLIAGVGGGGG